MKELAFTRAGKMHVAYEGNYRFVLWSVPPGEAVMRWAAEVYGRNAGPRKKPVAQEKFATRAQAIDWLARYRVPMETEAE